MSRRRRRFGATAENIFAGAHTTINSKELDVFYATVDAQFTMDDIVAWLFPEDVIKKLKDAYPLAKSIYHSHFQLASLPLPSGDKVSLNMDLDKVHMQCPIPEAARPHNDNPAILGVFQTICDINNRFNKVRKVVDWFGAHNVTLGAAAYYWPTIQALCPKDHPVNERTGERYREVNGIGEITPLLRETSGIMAGAHLCPVATDKPRGVVLSVTVLGEYSKQFTVL